jgi:protein ImuB
MHPLWLAIRLPHLPREVLPPDRSTRGQAPAATEATPLSPRAEREALRALCAAAYQFSGTVTAQPRAPQSDVHTLWLEIGSSLRLFQGLAPLLARLEASLARLGYSHALGIAPTLEGASVLACWSGFSRDGLCGSGSSRDGFCGSGFSRDHDPPPCYTLAELHAALKPLPATCLALPDDVLAALEGSGLARIGQVLELPLDALAMRFGYPVTDYLGRLTGRLADPRRWYRLPERYRRRFEFDGEIEALETLLFPLRRLLVEFQEYLVARDTGAQEFRVELEHEGAAPSVLTIGMGSPSRDAAHFQVLLRERFERTELAAPVRALTLLADRFVSPRARQLDFLNPRGSEDAEWGALLDRLRARLGAETVRGLGLAADHRPEKSWCAMPVGTASVGAASAATVGAASVGAASVGAASVGAASVGAASVGAASAATDPKRPLWLLPDPRPLASMPRCVAGPERIEGGWWDGLDATRDYYVAEGGAGARLWVYRERGSGSWFLQGLWS